MAVTKGLATYAVVPLGLCGGGYCLTYSVDKQLFRAVVDTGSPFLIVDGTCDAGQQGHWGCYYGEARPSGLAASSSDLSFAGQDVGVAWRRGSFALTLEPVEPGPGRVGRRSPRHRRCGIRYRSEISW